MRGILDDENICPSILYKYKSLDLNGNGIRLATFGELYFSHASDFNDPFECNFGITSPIFTMTDDELRSHLQNRLRLHHPHATRAEIDKLLPNAIRNVQSIREQQVGGLRSIQEQQRASMGLCSLSNDKGSIPMWAYYGDKHKGICVGIRVNSVRETRNRLNQEGKYLALSEIKYEEQLPIVDMENPSLVSENDLGEIENSYTTKSSQWRHEGEYRLMLWEPPRVTLRLGSEAVEEVVLGALCSDTNREMIARSLRDCGSGASLYQARASEYHYRLEFDELHY